MFKKRPTKPCYFMQFRLMPLYKILKFSIFAFYISHFTVCLHIKWYAAVTDAKKQLGKCACL